MASTCAVFTILALLTIFVFAFTVIVATGFAFTHAAFEQAADYLSYKFKNKFVKFTSFIVFAYLMTFFTIDETPNAQIFSIRAENVL